MWNLYLPGKRQRNKIFSVDYVPYMSLIMTAFYNSYFSNNKMLGSFNCAAEDEEKGSGLGVRK